MQRTSIKSLGFTLAEVLIISPIVILFIGIFIALLVNLTGESLVIREKNVAVYDTQAALDDIESSISQASAFLTQTTTSDLVSPQGKDNGTAPFTNTTAGQPDALIIRSAATDTSPADPARKFIYTGAGNCNSSNPVYTYYTVYFVAADNETSDPSDSALFKRTILPKPSAGYAACTPPWQRNSCNKDVVASNSTVCKTQDERLVGGVKWFDVSYFEGPNSIAKSSANTATDASVSLSISKKVAGSTIEHGASSQQVTSANIQPGVAQPTPVIPPPITWSRNNTGATPYNTVFQWTPVGSATNYSVRYRFNSGTWSAFQNVAQSSNPSFTVAGTARKEVPQVQVDVVTTNGNYTYGTMQATALPRWNSCVMPSGGWSNYGAPYNDMGFTKTTSGAVGLKGLIRYGSVGFNKNFRLCTLPEGFRPQDHLIFYASSHDASNGMGAARVDIWPDGAVVVVATPGGSNSWVSLDGIIFMTASGNPTWTNAALLSPWLYNSYGDTYSTPKYYQDGLGRAWIQGLASGGSPSTRLFWMPSTMAPQSGNFHIPAASDDRGSAVNINASPDVVGRPSSGNWVSTQFLYYSTGGLIDLPLYNGWYNYSNGWSLAKCYKGADDIVILQGLIAGGSASGSITHVLGCGTNAGMSTGRNAILPAWKNWETPARVDLNADNYLYSVTTNPGWTSLDGVHYIAD